MSKIYQPSGRAREYSPLALNLYHGCTHACSYCYVPKMFVRWNPGYRHADCYATLDEQELEQSARKMAGCEKQVLLSFTGDPYPKGVDSSATRTALEILHKYNHKVAILSKGGTGCLNDIEIFKMFGNRIKVGATLSFFTESESMKWEPGAASPEERIYTLQTLHDNGITTWASFEPVIDPEEALLVLERIIYLGCVDHVKIGKVNGMPSIEKVVDWADFLRRSVAICREAGLPFYIKESLRPFEQVSGIQLTAEEVNQDYLNV